MPNIRMVVDSGELDMLLNTITTPRDVSRVYNNSVSAGAQTAASVIRAATPRRTGQLRRSVGQVTANVARARYKVFTRKGDIRVVGFRVQDAKRNEQGWYAHFLEDGTKERTTFSRGRRGRVTPTRFAQRALISADNMIQLSIVERARQEIAKLVERARQS